MSAAEQPKPFDPETDTASYNPAKPGCVPIQPFGHFESDGKGGGTLNYLALQQKPGFRPKVVQVTVKKAPAVEGAIYNERGKRVGTLRYLEE